MASKQIATILSLKDKISSPLVKVSKNVDKVTREMKKSQNQIKGWGQSAIKSIDNVIKSTAKIGLTMGTLAGGLAVKTGFGEALDLEGYRVQLETATKDTKKAGDIMKWTIDLANKTPFESAPLVEGASKLEMMGMSAKKWLPLLGDMAAATNKPVDQAVEAMIDAQTGELERMKEFGITKAMIAKKAGEMFRGQEVVNAKGQIVDQEKFNEALTEIMKDRYAGGMEKLSNTTKGLWSTITGVTKSALATIVGITNDGTIRQGSMLATLKDKIKIIAGAFEKWQNDGTIDKIATKVTNAVTKMIQFFKTLFDFIRTHEKIITTVLVFVATIYTTVKVMGVMKKALTALKTIWMIFNGTLAITPLGWIVLAIGAVVAVGYLLYRNWDKVKAKAIELGGAFSEFGGKYLPKFMDVFKTLGGTVWDAILQMVDSLKPLWETVKTVFGQIYNVIKLLVPILMPIVTFIATIFIAKIVFSFMKMVYTVQAVVNIISGTLNGLFTIFSGVIDFVVGVFTGNWSMAWDGLSSILDGYIIIFKTLWQGLIDLLTVPIDAIVNMLDAVFKDKVQGIKNLWNELKNFLKNPIKGVVNIFKKDSGSGGGKGVDGSHRTGLPRVPFDGYIAELHKDETVLPKQEADEYRKGNNSADATDTTNSIAKVSASPGSSGDISVTVIVQGNVYGEDDLINKVGSTVYTKVKLAMGNTV